MVWRYRLTLRHPAVDRQDTTHSSCVVPLPTVFRQVAMSGRSLSSSSQPDSPEQRYSVLTSMSVSVMEDNSMLPLPYCHRYSRRRRLSRKVTRKYQNSLHGLVQTSESNPLSLFVSGVSARHCCWAEVECTKTTRCASKTRCQELLRGRCSLPSFCIHASTTV